MCICLQSDPLRCLCLLQAAWEKNVGVRECYLGKNVVGLLILCACILPICMESLCLRSEDGLHVDTVQDSGDLFKGNDPDGRHCRRLWVAVGGGWSWRRRKKKK